MELEKSWKGKEALRKEKGEVNKIENGPHT
jgi:hypothetical protein